MRLKKVNTFEVELDGDEEVFRQSQGIEETPYTERYHIRLSKETMENIYNHLCSHYKSMETEDPDYWEIEICT